LLGPASGRLRPGVRTSPSAPGPNSGVVARVSALLRQRSGRPIAAPNEAGCRGGAAVLGTTPVEVPFVGGPRVGSPSGFGAGPLGRPVSHRLVGGVARGLSCRLRSV
jgi:hypothetical protein